VDAVGLHACSTKHKKTEHNLPINSSCQGQWPFQRTKMYSGDGNSEVREGLGHPVEREARLPAVIMLSSSNIGFQAQRGLFQLYCSV